MFRRKIKEVFLVRLWN